MSISVPFFVCLCVGVAASQDQDFGTANLHVEVSDVVSVLVYVGVAKGNGVLSKTGKVHSGLVLEETCPCCFKIELKYTCWGCDFSFPLLLMSQLMLQLHLMQLISAFYLHLYLLHCLRVSPLVLDVTSLWSNIFVI